MNSMNLNLARKWRSKNFDTIVGQDLSIKMLKNSLYLGHYFPVYLFSGQRGCGKTSTARVFAAAVNCERLEDFKKNPKKQMIPCQECESCRALLEGRHPDFIEMDAASHTGVDNVRAIIDAASFMPIMGRKKVYLIDEAHMLSKAAFNALLKILEEPPESVLFILATTDPDKIIDTVTSRCFQLLFKPVEQNALLDHLANVCKKESIKAERDGLIAIIQATEGSVRDALNLVEQARFSQGGITKNGVMSLLGHIDDEQAFMLLQTLLTKTPRSLLAYLEESGFARYSAEAVWKKLLDIVRAALWLSYGVKPASYEALHDRLTSLVRATTPKRLHDIAHLLYEYEQLFVRTSAQHELLEMIFVKICQSNDPDDSGESGAPAAPVQDDSGQGSFSDDDTLEEDDGEEDNEAQTATLEVKAESAPQKKVAAPADSWVLFLAELEKTDDPLLVSIFKQGVYNGVAAGATELSLVFPKNLIFFDDMLTATKNVWQPLLTKALGRTLQLKPSFTGAESKKTTEHAKKEPTSVRHETERAERPKPKAAPQPAPQHAKSGYGQFSGGRRATKSLNVAEKIVSHKIDVSDQKKWQKATLLMHYFPGTIVEIQEPIAQSMGGDLGLEQEGAV